MLYELLSNELLAVATLFVVQGIGVALAGPHTTSKAGFVAAGVAEALLGIALPHMPSAGLWLVSAVIVVSCVGMYPLASVYFGSWELRPYALKAIRSGVGRRNVPELVTYLALYGLSWFAREANLISLIAANMWGVLAAISALWLLDPRVSYGLQTKRAIYTSALWLTRAVCGMALYQSIFR